MKNEAVIKSCVGSGALIFSDCSVSDEETSFTLTLINLPFVGLIGSSTYLAGSPAELFDDITKHWQGWSGEKSWEDIEGKLKLKATSDRQGHVTLKINGRDEMHENYLIATIHLEAAQLPDISKEIHSFFESETTRLG